MLATQYVALATTPIDKDDFAGPDVRYSGEYEALEAELEKSNSLLASGGPDWQRVIELAEQLLDRQSKDLRVACWLTWGLFRCKGISGLQAGLAMVVTLCETRWENLHPRKDRTRSAALGWLASRIETSLPELAATATAQPMLEQLTHDLSALDSCLNQRLGDEAPLLLPLRNRLRTQLNQVNAPAASTEVDTRPLSLVSSNPATAGVPTAVEDIFSPREAHRALRALQEQARPLCQWWQNQSVQDARAIGLSRLLLWLPIEALPEHDAQGKTGLRGLPADRLAAFRERMNQGKPAEVLRDLETSLARAPFWLDGQYLAWQCLDALKADGAKAVLEQHLNGLLKRLPGVETLKFFDGTRFASPDTLDWLASHVCRPPTAPSSSTEQAPDTGAEAWEQGYRTASELLGKEGLRPAMAVLQDGQRAARGGRARLYWQLAIARLCRQAGKHDLARNLLEAMEQNLRDSPFGEWEPELQVQVLRLLQDCYEQLPLTAVMRQRRDEVFQRLCHLDLEVVLESALGPKQ